MSDLYEVASDCGLDDGSVNDNTATKLWMTSCKHIICNKHLPVGFAFYPLHEYPSMSCPFCPSRHEATLFWIRGTDHGQHDPTIPSELFEVPEYTSSKPKGHESLALEIHHKGATAAAKLFATQTQVAVELLHKSKQYIKTLEQENESLKAKLYHMARSRIESSCKPSTTSVSNTSYVMQSEQHGSSRLTLKRPFQMSTPVARNTRVCLPERGVLHPYNTPQSMNLTGNSPMKRRTELEICGSPAFSMPYLRTNTLIKTSSLSPYQGTPIRNNPRIVEVDTIIEEPDDHNTKNDYLPNKSLGLRKTRNGWLQY